MNYCKDCMWFIPLRGTCVETRKEVEFKVSALYCCHLFEKVENVTYRLYPNGRLVSEDSFLEIDNEQPYYDDFYQTEVPAYIEDEDTIVNRIKAEMSGFAYRRGA